MPIVRQDILGSVNLGVFSFATDTYALIRKGVSTRLREKLGSVLKTDFFETDIGQSSLVGVLSTGNSNGILLPYYATDSEVEFLKKKIGIKVSRVPGILTCIGNNILCNNHGAIINPEYDSKAMEIIRKTLDVEVIKGKIGESAIVGSLGIATNKGVLVSPEITEEQLETYGKILKVPINTGTVNSGVYYVRSGIIANSYGAVVGSDTTGPELMRIEETLNVYGGSTND
ncbi:MAG: translation initiation factor IF-6 [Candidatus Odinarchaeia archaeon]